MAAVGSVPAGTRVGRYEIVSLLRQGGMGEVYSAEDRNLGRRVALKILPKHRTSDPERVARFVREARASSTLNHPSIVSVHDAGSEGDVHFLAMELIDGQPLSEWMRRRRSLAAKVEVMAQVADGLARAHDAGIIHRDLKPDNVMVTSDGRAKIVDFGVAKLTERLGERAAITGVSTPTSRVGTTAYMSPEQIEGRTVDRRTDVFSFGTVLYELLTGTNPFAAPQYADTIHNVVHLDPPMERVPRELRRIVQRCLRKDRERRYDSMRDVALDLREAAGDEEQPPRRGRWIALALAAVIAATIGAWWTLDRRAATTQGEQQGMTMTRLTHSGKVTTAAISPDGKYLVHAVQEEGGEALYVKQIATNTITRIAGPVPAFHFNLSVSPDGNYAYYVAATRAEPNVGHVYQLPLLGGEPRRIAEDTEYRYDLSPDGTRIVFCRFSAITRESRLTVAAVDGGGEQVLLQRKHPDFISTPEWMPDGESITFFAWNATRKDGEALYRLHVASRKLSPVATPRFRGVDTYLWLSDRSGALVSVFEREQPPQVWYVPTGSTEGRKITSDVSAYTDVTATADSKSIAAVRDVSDSNIYVYTLGERTGDAMALTSGFGNWVGYNGVRFRGSEVLFSSSANGFGAFYAVDAGGGTPRRVIESMATWGLNVSRDGSRLVFVSDKSGANEIWMADADGGNVRRLTSHGSAVSPSFTPDGRSVVYLRMDDGQRAWRLPLDGGPAVRITNVPTNRPEVSPDGKWLLCRLRSTEPGVPLWRTAVVPLDGKGPVRYFGVPTDGGPPTMQWHPRGDGFLFVDSRGGFDNIWQQELGGGAPRQLTSFDSGEIFAFDVSRDGKRLAVARGQSTRDAVLMRHFR
ncbi:MAG TPA: protein kinase [Thermoanaerobaculia bacterium]|jgi:Tol biopolymer transport system component/predicted Ser/Thr protein kinase